MPSTAGWQWTLPVVSVQWQRFYSSFFLFLLANWECSVSVRQDQLLRFDSMLWDSKKRAQQLVPYVRLTDELVHTCTGHTGETAPIRRLCVDLTAISLYFASRTDCDDNRITCVFLSQAIDQRWCTRYFGIQANSSEIQHTIFKMSGSELGRVWSVVIFGT